MPTRRADVGSRNSASDAKGWQRYYQRRCFEGRSVHACAMLGRLAHNAGDADLAKKAKADAELLSDKHHKDSLKKREAGCAKNDAFDCFEAARLVGMRKGTRHRVGQFRRKARRLESKLRSTYAPHNYN